ncbi:SelT/SelW/SelH family protein [bacterium]|nr:SelT/SelW/SelH family protein [bacterium]
MKKQGFADPELVRSGGGAFEIRKNGILLFSKLQEHRFPTDSEVIELLKDK